VNEPRPSLRDALAALIVQTQGEPGEHPDAERWLAYHRGELPRDQEEALREHLVVCRECFDLVQAVVAFDSDREATARGGGATGDLSTTASWRLLRERLAKEDGPGVDLPPFALSGRVQPPRWLYSVAAALLVALVGVGGWSLHLHRELAELRRPMVNPVTILFGPSERAEGNATADAVPGPWTLVFYPPPRPAGSAGSYRLELREISAAGERRLYMAEGLSLDADFGLTWVLPEGLAPGQYRIDLSILEDEGWRLLDSYPLRVDEGAGETGP
jgi:hypothetical protein